MRFTVIGVVIAGIAGLFAYAGGWLTPHALTPASMINTFEKVNGRDLLQIGASLTQLARYTIPGRGPCRSSRADQTGL